MSRHLELSLIYSNVGQHKKNEEFGRVCATRLIPAIRDGDFCLFER